MTISVERFDSADAFLKCAQPFLVRNEALHNLLLGIAGELVTTPHLYGEAAPFLAALVDQDPQAGGSVIGAALRTPPHRLSISMIDALHRAEALQALADAVAAAYAGDLPGVSGPSEIGLAFAELWRRRFSQPYQRSMALRIYELTEVTAPDHVPGSIRMAGESDRALVRRWLAAFQHEAMGAEISEERADIAATRWLSTPGRSLFVWEYDGQVVSMTGCAGMTPHGIRIGAVYTPPELRGRGYASACVASASQHMLDAGRALCFLYTDLANPTSNKIYQRIGYRAVADVNDYDFVTQ